MKTFLVALTLLLLSTSAFAQGRTFPKDSQRGVLSPAPQGRMVLNQVDVLASPGLQIRDRNNMLITPSMVKPNSIVKYKMDGQYLHRVWVLSKREIETPEPGAQPAWTYPSE